MKWFSMFSGIGGFELGLIRAGHNVVGGCEIDEHARSVYSRHFPETPLWKDATKINPNEVPDCDGICAGFPCQAFSVAGKRLGLEDARGTLFYEIVRIADKKRPRYLFLENVRGLLHHDEGRTLTTIIKVFHELGYEYEWQVINSKYFVPQSRERIFIIGHLGEKPVRKIFPLIEDVGLSEEQQEPTTVRTLTGGGHSGGLHSQMTLIYLSQKNMNMKQRIQERSESWTLTGNGSDFGLVTGSIRTGGRGSLDRHTWDVLKHDKRIRRLTPLECERLQGFPDGWTEGISDTQRYKCLGNAVTVPVVEYIARRFNN